ncbi:lycopene beta-cyclase CrtY [Atlantibacter hermannii]|uniref:lycopene beta-cyclase CrtY n=1 Tax=Atlantibacter hermannii TaxID=565 RepID=UPI00289A0521|nr:lycopene beta-cyclase CrtY [Atlantibacter hermannii]
MQWDLILVGAGLANGLIAWRLQQVRPELNVLLIEQGEAAGGNHTWSFHHHDLSPEQHQWIAPLVAHSWPGYDVMFPSLTRHIDQPYYTLFSDRFAHRLTEALGDNLRLNCPVAAVSPQRVQLANGDTLTARAVIDGRGQPDAPTQRCAWQLFVGQEWRLAHPHDLTRPLLMDATVPQCNAYRFFYLLPLSPDTLLIEDTRFSNAPALNRDDYRAAIKDYAAQRHWTLSALLREESGCLPLTLAGAPPPDSTSQQPCSGMRAGLFHAVTGYSLPLAVRLADAVAGLGIPDAPRVAALTHALAAQQWRSQGFFRLLNRMLFLAGQPDHRWRVMQRFYGLPDETIARFYAGNLTLSDKARILTGKPPVPVFQALRAAFNTGNEQ